MLTLPSPRMTLMLRKVKASMPTMVVLVRSGKLQSLWPLKIYLVVRTEDKASSDSDGELPIF